MAKLYGPVAAQVNVYSGTIRADSIEVIDRFDASIFNANPNVQAVAGTISFLYAKFDPAEGFRLTATLADSSQGKLADYGDGQTSEEYGIFFEGIKPRDFGYIDLTSTPQTVHQTKKINKLYGPVDDGNGGYVTKKITKLYGAVSDGNGGYETKLIYEDV